MILDTKIDMKNKKELRVKKSEMDLTTCVEDLQNVWNKNWKKISMLVVDGKTVR